MQPRAHLASFRRLIGLSVRSVNKRLNRAERKLKALTEGPPPQEDRFQIAGEERAARAATARSPDRERHIDKEHPVNVRPCIDSQHLFYKLTGSSLEQKKMRMVCAASNSAVSCCPAPSLCIRCYL